MAESLIFTDKEIAFLRELARHKVDFMIVGLSAAALQGSPVVTQDVDLWFANLNEPGIKKALDAVGGSSVPPTAAHPPLFAGDAVKLVDIVMHLPGLGPFKQGKKYALDVPLHKTKVAVLGLERIIKSKKATGRPKDKLAVPVLQDALIAIRESRSKQEI